MYAYDSAYETETDADDFMGTHENAYETEIETEIETDDFTEIRHELWNDLQFLLNKNSVLSGQDKIDNALDCLELSILLIGYGMRPSFTECVHNKIHEFLSDHDITEKTRKSLNLMRELITFE